MSGLKTFIIPGDLTHVARMSASLSDDVCGILIHSKVNQAEARLSGVVPERFAQVIYTLCSLDEFANVTLDDQGQSDYEGCLSGICADPRVHYLATRSYFNSAFNNTIVIERIVLNSLLIISKTRPSRLIASSTPHSVGAWIFAKCFEYLHLPVFVLERTPINDRAWIYRGLDKQSVVRRSDMISDRRLGKSSLKLMREQRAGKPGAKDANGFYLSRLDLGSIKGADSNKWWSYLREFNFLRSGRLISLPIRLVSFYLKRSLLRSYVDVATSVLPKTPFIIYFMHYQPERTSLPEGLLFAQQWLALRLLSWAMPEGWTLLVREHPSMWLNALDITVRTPNLYRDIASLPNAKICSMDVDTFEIIDESRAVATLTGSVGFQAILRNRPVLAFGIPAYKDHPACFSVSSLGDLRRAIQIVEREDLRNRFSDEALVQYLAWIEGNSFCADPGESDWLEARLKNFSEIYRRVLHRELDLQSGDEAATLAIEAYPS
jgi:Capsule polysaccharide biosynthesis protein